MLVGITGYAQHGKDTAANVLVETYGYTKLSFAEPLRQLALRLNPYVLLTDPGVAWRYADLMTHGGYEFAKTNYPEVRRILQELGTGARDIIGDDVWVDAAKAAMDRAEKPVVFNDVRFPNEARLILDNGGELWRVGRLNDDGTPWWNGVGSEHPSEHYISSLPARRVLLARSVEEVEDAVHQVMMGMAGVGLCEP